MRIGIVCPYDLGRPGGVQSHIIALARALQERDHYVRVIAPLGGVPENAEGIAVAAFGRRRAVAFNQTRIDVTLAWGAEAARLDAWLAHEAFDVLHFHTIWDPLLPWQVLRRAGRAARVATFHDTPPDTIQGRITRSVFRRLSHHIAARVDRVTAVSAAPAGHLTPCPGTELALMPPAIDLSRIAARARAPDATAELEILCLGRLDARKGVDVLVDAFARLERDGLPANLSIVGSGDRHADLAAKVSALGLRRVSLEGTVDEATKAARLARADIFCAPALHGESFGVVLVEAMAAGLPVVAAANPGYMSVLADAPADSRVRPGDAAELAGRLRGLVTSPARRQALAAWSRANWQRHDISAWIGAFEEVFASAIEQRRRKKAR